MKLNPDTRKRLIDWLISAICGLLAAIGYSSCTLTQSSGDKKTEVPTNVEISVKSVPDRIRVDTVYIDSMI